MFHCKLRGSVIEYNHTIQKVRKTMMNEKEPWEVTPTEEEATIRVDHSEEVLEQKD